MRGAHKGETGQLLAIRCPVGVQTRKMMEIDAGHLPDSGQQVSFRWKKSD